MESSAGPISAEQLAEHREIASGAGHGRFSSRCTCGMVFTGVHCGEPQKKQLEHRLEMLNAFIAPLISRGGQQAMTKEQLQYAIKAVEIRRGNLMDNIHRWEWQLKKMPYDHDIRDALERNRPELKLADETLAALDDEASKP